MRRRNRWIIALLSVAGGLVLAVWLFLHIALPILVQKQVASIFRNAGFQDARFEVENASPWKTTIGTISAGKGEWLKIGNVAVEYSPLQVLHGEITNIFVREGRVVISLDDLPDQASASSTSVGDGRIPVQGVELQSCVLVLRRGDNQIELPVDGTLLRTPSGSSQLNARCTVEKGFITIAGTIDLARHGQADLTANASAIDLSSIVPMLPDELRKSIGEAGGTIDAKAEHHRGGATTMPVTTASIQIDDGYVVGKGDYEGELRGVFTKVKIDSLNPLSIPAGQWLTFASLKAAGQEFSHARIVFETKSLDNVSISDAQVGWAGGRFKADPFVVAMSTGAIRSTISAEHVDMAEALSVVTQGKATGTGRLSGKVPLSFDGSHFAFGDGIVKSEGPGTMRLGESTNSISEVLDQTDPRFARDAQMRQVKQQILQALTDFQYSSVEADLTHQGAEKELVVAVTITGTGRTGAKQPLDITLNFRGFEHGLNSYLSARSRVLKGG